MLRSHPGGWSAARQAVFALLPVVIGAGVLLAAGNGPVTGMSRLEATQSSVARSLDPPPVVSEAPAAVVVGGVAGATAVAAPAAAPTVEPVADLAPVDRASPPPAPAGSTGTGDGPSAAAAEPIGAPVASSPAADGQATTAAPASAAPSTSSSTTTTSTTTTAPAPPAGRARNAGAEADIVPVTNADRRAAGLGTLSRNGCLDSVASGFAEQMARSGVLAHNSGAGPAVNGCRANATWGDNVGMTTACDTATLEQEWMASPGHRRNILNAAFAMMGVGVWTDEKGICWAQVLFSS